MQTYFCPSPPLCLHPLLLFLVKEQCLADDHHAHLIRYIPSSRLVIGLQDGHAGIYLSIHDP